jgi:radical SAM protein with 4Fe4S-binding SPASM domain
MRNNFHKQLSLDWIDPFIQNVRPYIFVRTEDNILIKRPNQATKINVTGAKILQFLLQGGTIKDLLNKTGVDKTREIEMFMLAVKNYLEGNLDEFSGNPAVETSLFSLNFSKLPVLSELALTYKCNLKCKFCYAGCNCTVNPAGSGKELSTEQFKAIIYSIYHEAKVPSISFTGGEPTLRPDLLLECIRFAKSLEMRVNLITNGTLIDEHLAKKLKMAGLDSAQISLEGVSEKIHDKLVQSKGAFQKSIQTVALLKNQNIYVHTNTTLNQQNREECLLIPEFVNKTLKLDRFSMNLVIPTGSSIINQDLVISYTEVGNIIKEIQALSKKNAVEFMWYSPVPMCLFNTITHELGNKGCAACDGLISVAPNGDILPCASYDRPVGNLTQTPFKDIWQGADARYFRNKSFAHLHCQSCESFAICNGGCPLYWRNTGYHELLSTPHYKTL